MRRYIKEGLERFLSAEPKAWHMPGHKRKNMAILSEGGVVDTALAASIYMDVTEVPGTDDLYEPTGMIKFALEELKLIYGTEQSYYLVNGATGGILAAIYAVAQFIRSEHNKKPKMAIATNSHKSVDNAVRLADVELCYITPQLYKEGDIEVQGAITKEAVEGLFLKGDIDALVITSPTYEGIVSDIEGIAKVVHSHGAYLIVDEAHGALMQFADFLPKSAVGLGADVVVQSLHKTMPAFTQTALIHNNNPELLGVIRDAISMFMTSSPSYPMLCSMEAAVYWGVTEDFFPYMEELKNFRTRVNMLERIFVFSREQSMAFGAFDYDISRIVLFAEGITGIQLLNLLREKNIVVEMAGSNYVVLISTPMDDKADFEYLYSSLKEIDEGIGEGVISSDSFDNTANTVAKIESLVGKKAVNDYYIYPPGSYIIKKGEIISDKQAEELVRYARAGLNIRGLEITNFDI